MYSKKLTYLFLVVGCTILTLFGCGEDTEEPVPDPADGLFSKADLVGSWDVVSVNDMEPSRFITLLLFKELNGEVPVEEVAPAAPEGEIIILDGEPQEVYDVTVDLHEFYYTFETDDLWTLRVQFDVLSTGEPPPIVPGEGANPGGGILENPIDPNIPASPAANATNEVKATWSGTCQVASDTLTLTIETEDVKTTAAPEVNAEAELIRRFNIGFFNPFSKTFIAIDDAGKLTLKMSGSSRGKMILEKR